MKLNRIQIRRLVESVVSENVQSPTGSGGVGDYSPAIASSSIAMLDDLAQKLQIAMYGAGHDMNMIGKINKYATGFGTDEDAIIEVFEKIVDFAASGDADHLYKSPQGRDYEFITPIGSLKYVASVFKRHNETTDLGAALVDELGIQSKEFEELNRLIPGFLDHITSTIF